MTDLNKLPKDILIKMLTTIQEKTRKEYEDQLSFLKEENRIIKSVTNVVIYRCSYKKCKAMLSYGRYSHVVSGCESFKWCNCVEEMSLSYCNIHKCKNC